MKWVPLLASVFLLVSAGPAAASSPQITNVSGNATDLSFGVGFMGSGFTPFEQFTGVVSVHAFLRERCSDGSRLNQDLGTLTQSHVWTARETSVGLAGHSPTIRDLPLPVRREARLSCTRRSSTRLRSQTSRTA